MLVSSAKCLMLPLEMDLYTSFINIIKRRGLSTFVVYHELEKYFGILHVAIYLEDTNETICYKHFLFYNDQVFSLA